MFFFSKIGIAPIMGNTYSLSLSSIAIVHHWILEQLFSRTLSEKKHVKSDQTWSLCFINPSEHYLSC